MNRPSGLLERLSPRPIVCPLARLDHHNSSNEGTAASPEGSTYLSDEFTYRRHYVKPYQDRETFQTNRLLAEKCYSKNIPNSEYLQSFYDSNSYSNDEPEYRTSCEANSKKDNKYSDLLDNFTKLGKTSPSILDQGYQTLVSPCHESSITQNLWTEANCKGKKFYPKNNSFDRLTDVLVIKIFSFLTSIELSICAQVCRRFDTLAWTPMLWRIITLDDEAINGDKAIRGVLRQLCGQGRTGACPSVEKVCLTNGARLSDRSVMLLARRCPELTHLQLQGCSDITNNSLFEIATRCHNLQHLDVTGCVKVSCIGINAGPDPPRRLHLQYLDLTDCVALQDSGLMIIVQNCPQLTYLYLRRCVQITDAGLKFLPSFCSGLRELSISDCTNLTDFGLYELAKLGATLRYLSVAKCDQVSDAGLKMIARKCYKLRYLNARGCEAVSDDAITVLARSCTRLRALDIGRCDVSDAGLRALAESCPNLTKLSLRNCDLVTDRGVQCVAYYCRGLQQLNIQDCQISLEGYRAVKKYCKRCVIEHTNPGFF